MGERIIEVADNRGEFIRLEDGFLYYWPIGPGALSAHHLRVLADELDRRNAEWEAQLNAYFEEHK